MITTAKWLLEFRDTPTFMKNAAKQACELLGKTPEEVVHINSDYDSSEGEPDFEEYFAKWIGDYTRPKSTHLGYAEEYLPNERGVYRADLYLHPNGFQFVYGRDIQEGGTDDLWVSAENL